MTCAEYNKYIYFFQRSELKCLILYIFLCPFKCIPGPCDVTVDRKKLLEKNTGYLLCDSVLQTVILK